MNRFRSTLCLIIAGTFLISTGFASSALADVHGDIANIQSRWANVKYDLKADEQEKAFEQLADEATHLRNSNSQNPEAWIWEGIVLSTWAGAKGGLGALSIVKKAKASFEAALRLDEKSLGGSAHTSLGSLYYQVPGWPVGFGDDDLARQHLQQGLTLNPDGIDSNYFWADFLFEQGEYAQARAAAEKALQAPDRPGRERADQGRREEIRALLARIDRKLKR